MGVWQEADASGEAEKGEWLLLCGGKGPVLTSVKNQRALERTQRELEREKVKLQQQEKKLVAEIKKSAKNGQMSACKIQAKDLVRTKK